MPPIAGWLFPAHVLPGVDSLPALYDLAGELFAHSHRGDAVPHSNLQQ
jgi:hypothetical protein